VNAPGRHSPRGDFGCFHSRCIAGRIVHPGHSPGVGQGYRCCGNPWQRTLCSTGLAENGYVCSDGRSVCAERQLGPWVDWWLRLPDTES